MILTENARLRLRTMCRDDLEELYALLSDAEVMRWLEPPFSRTPVSYTHLDVYKRQVPNTSSAANV